MQNYLRSLMTLPHIRAEITALRAKILFILQELQKIEQEFLSNGEWRITRMSRNY